MVERYQQQIHGPPRPSFSRWYLFVYDAFSGVSSSSRPE